MKGLYYRTVGILLVTAAVSNGLLHLQPLPKRSRSSIASITGSTRAGTSTTNTGSWFSPVLLASSFTSVDTDTNESNDKKLDVPVKKVVSKKQPVWTYAWLQGEQRETAYNRAEDLQQEYLSNYRRSPSHGYSHSKNLVYNWTAPETLNMVKTGMDILVQWAKLGEGDACLDFCGEFMLTLPSHAIDQPTYSSTFCRAYRRVLNAYINAWKAVAWDQKTRKQLYKIEEPRLKTKALNALERADEVLAKMEIQSRQHTISATNTKDGITTIPSSLMDSQDYTSIIVGYCQMNQVVPALRALRRIEHLYHANLNLTRLAPALSVYAPLTKALVTVNTKKLYERLGKSYEAHEMACMIGQEGINAFLAAGQTPPIQLYNHILTGYSRVIPPPPPSKHNADDKVVVFHDEALEERKYKIASAADAIFVKMMDDDVEPNVKTLTALIYTFTKSDWLPEAHALMEGLIDYLFDAAAIPGRRLEMVDIRCVRLLANALSKEGEPFQVQDIISYMWALVQKGYQDVQPDVYLYTTALAAWVHDEHGLEHAKEMFDEMRQKYNVIPDVPAYNALLNVIAKHGEGGADEAGALVAEMKQAGLKPDTVTYNTLMEACLNTPGGHVKAEQTLLWMLSSFSNPTPNARSYNQLIRGFLNIDMVKAEYWLDRMEERITPHGSLYESLILQWCQVPNQAERAQALLERMQELYEEGGAQNKPRRSSYNSVIRACQDQDKLELASLVRQARNSVYPDSNKVEAVRYTSNGEIFALLEELDRDVGGLVRNPAATTRNFNVMLEFLANSGEVWAGQRSEDVLNFMLELHLKRGNADAKPNIVSFNIVMAAWAKSSYPDAGDKAVAILGKLDALHKMGLMEDVQSDRITYNTIMNAYAKSDTSNSAGMAENFFHELEGRYEATGDENFQPDIISYTTLLNAYASSRAPGAAMRAEEILLQMNKVYQDDNTKVKPNTLCFNEVLLAWAKSRDPNALQRAELVLRLMEDMHKAGNADVKPTVRSYNIVLLAAASGPKQDAAIRAQLFFDRMKESDHIVPDAVSYNTIMEACAKNGGEDAIQSINNLLDEAYVANGVVLNSVFFGGVISALSRVGLRGATAAAEKIVQDLESNAGGGKLDFEKVDTNIYNALINCWAKSGESESPVRAEEILTQMESEHAKGNYLAKPNVQTYSSVADCWAKSKEPDAGTRAEALLDRMEQLGIQPSVRTYTTVIQAFARSQCHDKAMRSQSILNRMKKDFTIAKNPAAQPTIVAYNALLNACEFTDGNERDMEEAFKVACQAFDEMRSTPDMKLDHVTYGSFLGVINELVPKSDIRNEMVRLVFKRCCSDGQLGSLTLKKLQDAGGPTLCRELLNGMSESNFPASWSCNVNEK